jgi:tricorn protease
VCRDLGARYFDWVHARRLLVHARTNGTVGYVHVPDCEAHGFAEFTRAFDAETASLRRSSLILDLRHNAGGCKAELMLARLVQPLLGFNLPRWGKPTRYPEGALAGPLVVLVNENTCSDGDVFCQSIKSLGLGVIVGVRTWGGVNGSNYGRNTRLVDGTTVSQSTEVYRHVIATKAAPTAMGVHGNDEHWLDCAENVGVRPDVEVAAGPQSYFDAAVGGDNVNKALSAADLQLARAIAVAKGLLAQRKGL